MIKFDNQSKISEVKKQITKQQSEEKKQPHTGSANRPHVVNAKVY